MAVFLLLKQIQMLVTWMLTHHHIQGSLAWHTGPLSRVAHPRRLSMMEGCHYALVRHTALGLRVAHRSRLWALWLLYVAQLKLALSY